MNQIFSNTKLTIHLLHSDIGKCFIIIYLPTLINKFASDLTHAYLEDVTLGSRAKLFYLFDGEFIFVHLARSGEDLHVKVFIN